VWAISSDKVDKLAAYARDEGITFPLLSDADLEVIKRYGVLNERARTIAVPTALVLDREGVVRYARTDEDYTRRPPASELLGALAKLGAR
jgi:peroxiredoxin Q/BCP